MGNSSRLIKTPSKTVASRLIKAVQLGKGIYVDTNETVKKDAQFGFKAIVQTPEVILSNEEIDFEFDVPFDDDIIGNEATITLYNLSPDTINKFNAKKTCRITAGYGNDTGVIFEGYITDVKTKFEGADKITTVYAVDDIQYSSKLVDEMTFSEGTSASYILKSLLNRLNLPIAVFKIQRDHTYDSETKVDGNIVENIKTYSDVCGVSTYVYKQQLYCRPIWDGWNTNFTVTSSTGMIGAPEPFEEESTSEEYQDTVTGYDITMLMQYRLGTAAIVKVNSRVCKGDFRVPSGKHVYDGLSATTEIRAISNISTKIVAQPKSSSESYDGTGGSGAIDKAVSWAVKIANDDSHGYSQSSRWGPNYDCSSFVISAYQQAGINLKGAGANSTRDMYNAFTNCGFRDVTSSITLSNGNGLKKGDVLLNVQHHAAMVQNNNKKLVYASTSSRGIVANQNYYVYSNGGWNYVLRYSG